MEKLHLLSCCHPSIDIEAPIAICPEDITRNTDLGQAYATISWRSPRGTDNSGTISSINADPREGQFAIGSHVITVTVVDPAGLEGQCTFDIVVQGTYTEFTSSVWS